MALTDSSCKNAKPTAKPRKLSDSQGLYLEIMPSGSKYWRLKYRFMGKEKRLALGVYPEISLAEARQKKDDARKILNNGADPSFVKKEQKRQAKRISSNTFESIAKEWHEHKTSGWTPLYAVSILRRLENDIFPVIGHLPISDITAPQILDVLRLIEKRGAFDIAKRAMQTCGQIFRFAIVTGLADRNPVTDLKGALKPYKQTHYSALDIKELPEFLHKLEKNDARLFFLTRHAMHLLILTFVRTGELINAKWNEFDLEAGEWIIPAERMKMRKQHIVPLSRQAIEILKEIQTQTGQWDLVFPNQITSRKSMSNNTILKAIERMGYKGKTTGHGFRALAMTTIKEKLNYRHEVIDRQLAHSIRNKVDAAYDRAMFLDERKIMMQKWADYLDAICSNGKVIIGDFRRTA